MNQKPTVESQLVSLGLSLNSVRNQIMDLDALIRKTTCDQERTELETRRIQCVGKEDGFLQEMRYLQTKRRNGDV